MGAAPSLAVALAVQLEPRLVRALDRNRDRERREEVRRAGHLHSPIGYASRACIFIDTHVFGVKLGRNSAREYARELVFRAADLLSV